MAGVLRRNARMLPLQLVLVASMSKLSKASQCGSTTWMYDLNVRAAWDHIPEGYRLQLQGSPGVLVLPYGAKYHKKTDECGFRKLVVFNSKQTWPWLRYATKVGAGIAIGAGAVASLPWTLGAAVGLSAAGPVAGGWFAAHTGAGIAAGGFMSGLQSFVMTGVGTKLIAAGGAAGAYFSSMFKGAAEVNEASCDREATLQDFGDVNMYRIDKDGSLTHLRGDSDGEVTFYVVDVDTNRKDLPQRLSVPGL
mmetsp:Transcript_40349/g.90476  ORF Transcript_40349/g.90476 Transcript_40349/m.90476 type:complete len:250 (+) Transcript_40349:86-835(+)